MIVSFFSPYFMWAYSGAYALLQNLQALGLLSIWTGPYIDLKGTITPLSGLYFVCLIFIIILNIFSSFAFTKKVTISLIIFWITPGVLSILGISVFDPIIPDEYRVGSGNLGTSGGALINALIVFVFSWSVTTFVYHSFRTGKKTKAAFDHVWYMFGLSALAFFVSDMGINRHNEGLQSSKETLVSASDLLQSQFDTLSSYCSNEEFKFSYSALCLWVTPAQRYISNISEGGFFYETMEDKPTLDKLLGISAKVDKSELAENIQVLNQMCVVKSNLQGCIEIPLTLNLDPDLVDGDVSIYTKYLIPLQPLMPTIERYWSQTIQYAKKVKESEMAPHMRWMFFMMIAFFVGVKVANSSRELFTTRSESIYRASIKAVIKWIWILIRSLLRRLKLLFIKVKLKSNLASNSLQCRSKLLLSMLKTSLNLLNKRFKRN